MATFLIKMYNEENHDINLIIHKEVSATIENLHLTNYKIHIEKSRHVLFMK